MTSTAIWHQEAERRFPGVTRVCSGDTDLSASIALWGELVWRLHQAYETGDTRAVDEIYGFYRWCDDLLSASADSPGLGTLAEAMAIGFDERVCRNKQERDDLPRWFSREYVIEHKELFAFDLTKPGSCDEGLFRSILAAFDEFDDRDPPTGSGRTSDH